nr:phosphoglycerate dehydrogenase [uncultured Desulfobacter sp.]
MKSKVLIGTSSFGKEDPKPVELLQAHGLEVILNPYGRKLMRDELIELLQGVDALLAGLEIIDRQVLEASSLKVVSRCGSGISNVDVDTCREMGIVFKYTPFGPTQAVAELTVGMVIMLLREACAMNSSLHQGKWDKRVGFQLKKKTVVIIGFGKIGRRTASLLKPFNVNLIAVDPLAEQGDCDVRIMALDQALALADIIIIHASGEEKIIHRQAFEWIRHGAFICNAARGINVDETALLEALNCGKVAGVWLDAFATEPYSGPLCGHPNVLLTPHVGSYTREGRLQMEMDAAQNLIDGLILKKRKLNFQNI